MTLCVAKRECLLSNIHDDVNQLNEFGQIVAECWEAIPNHFDCVEVADFVVMPNHLHGLLFIIEKPIIKAGSVGAGHDRPVPPTVEDRGKRKANVGAGHDRPGLSTIIGLFKSSAAKRINVLRNTPGFPVWQRSYYERIIRNEGEFIRIQQYIAENPLKWATDEENMASGGLSGRS